MAAEKLTRQGVRDLGGNRRIRPPDEYEYEYVVRVGHDGVGGIFLRISAANPKGAFKRAKEILASTYTAAGMNILEITHRGRVAYHYLYGWGG